MKKFIKNIIQYFFGSVLSKAVMFFMLPLITARVPDEGYGYYSTVSAVFSVVVPLFCLEVWTGILRYTYDYKNRLEKQRVVSNGMLFMFISTALYTAAFLVFMQFMEVQYALLVYILGAASMFDNMYRGAARGLNRNTVYMISGLIGTLSNVIVNLVLILCFNMQEESLIISAAASHIAPIIFIEAAVGVGRKFRLSHFDKTLFKSLVIYCLPLSVNTVAYFLLTGVNKIIISDKLGLAQAGYYEIASKFALVISLIMSVYNLAWQEMAYESGNDAGHEKHYSKMYSNYIRFVGGGTLLLIPATYIIFPFMVNGSYTVAKAILPMYYIGTLASSVSQFLGAIFCAEKKTRILLNSAVAGAAVNLLILFLFLSKFGLQTASVSLAVSFTVSVVLRMVSLRAQSKDYKFDLKYTAVFFIFMIPVCICYYIGGLAGNIIMFFVCGIFMLITCRDMLRQLLSSLPLRRAKK